MNEAFHGPEETPSISMAQSDRVPSPPLRRGNAISDGMWKDLLVRLKMKGAGTQRLNSSSPPTFWDAFTSFKVLQGSQKKSNSMQARGDLDSSLRAARQGSYISPSAVTAEPAGTKNADFNSMTEWKHVSIVQEARRLRRMAKLKQVLTADGPEVAKARAEVVTATGVACSACGGAGLACADSLSKRAPGASTLFGSLDNSSYNLVTVCAIPFTASPLSASHIYPV